MKAQRTVWGRMTVGVGVVLDSSWRRVGELGQAALFYVIGDVWGEKNITFPHQHILRMGFI